jgi:hypothetical protein
MALIQSDVASGKKNIPQPFDASLITVPVEVTLPATAPASGDIIEVAKIPPGVKIVGFSIVSPQLDSNGAPALVVAAGKLNSGKTDLGTVYETGLTPGRTTSGNIVRNGTALPYTDDATVERNFGLKVTTVAATYVASQVVLVELRLKN